MEKHWIMNNAGSIEQALNNVVYSKTMENLRNGINVKLVRNKKDYLKWKWKPSYMSLKTFDNNWWKFVKTKLC